MVNIIRLSKYAVCAGVFSFLLSSCDNFFDVAPHDAITPATFWKTEADAEAGLTACYNWWFDQCTGPNYIFFRGGRLNCLTLRKIILLKTVKGFCCLMQEIKNGIDRTHL